MVAISRGLEIVLILRMLFSLEIVFYAVAGNHDLRRAIVMATYFIGF